MEGTNRLALRNRINLKPLEIQEAERFKIPDLSTISESGPGPQRGDNNEVSQPAPSIRPDYELEEKLSKVP